MTIVYAALKRPNDWYESASILSSLTLWSSTNRLVQTKTDTIFAVNAFFRFKETIYMGPLTNDKSKTNV